MSGKSPVQTTVQVGTKNITLSADTGEGMKELSAEVASQADAIIDNLTAIEQVITAKTVMSSPVVGTPERGAGPQLSTPPPPAGGAPTCNHGPMLDLAGKGYKYRWYCTLDTKDWKQKCKPIAG